MKLPAITGLLLLAGLTLFSIRPAAAQSAAEDSALYKKAAASLIALYHSSAGDQSGLFNGSQYAGYPFSFAGGHPFFNSDKPGTGWVLYDGLLYENVTIQFDEVQEVLCLHDSQHRIQLINDRLERFSLYNNNFVRIVKDTDNAVLVRTGFYNVLYDGSVSLLKKEEKVIRDDVTTGEIRRFVDDKQYYYLKRGNSWNTIKSKKSILNLFKDKKKELRQYISKNKLSFRKDKDNMLMKTTAYYDQLIK